VTRLAKPIEIAEAHRAGGYQNSDDDRWFECRMCGAVAGRFGNTELLGDHDELVGDGVESLVGAPVAERGWLVFEVDMDLRRAGNEQPRAPTSSRS